MTDVAELDTEISKDLKPRISRITRIKIDLAGKVLSNGEEIISIDQIIWLVEIGTELRPEQDFAPLLKDNALTG